MYDRSYGTARYRYVFDHDSHILRTADWPLTRYRCLVVCWCFSSQASPWRWFCCAWLFDVSNSRHRRRRRPRSCHQASNCDTINVRHSMTCDVTCRTSNAYRDKFGALQSGNHELKGKTFVWIHPRISYFKKNLPKMCQCLLIIVNTCSIRAHAVLRMYMYMYVHVHVYAGWCKQESRMAEVICWSVVL